MKITFIGTLPPLKALSPYCFHLAYALSKKINLEFISFKEILPEFLYWGGTKESNNVAINKIRYKRILNWYNPISWIKTGVKVSGDIIHVQHWALYSGLAYVFILLIAKIRRKKVIITVHNITPHTDKFIDILLDKILNKIIFPFADSFIVHNKRNKEKFIHIYNVDEKLVYILPHGTLYPYKKLKDISKEGARKHLNMRLSKKVILFFGYIWDYKGLTILLESLKIVKEKIKDVVLIIAGQPPKDWEKYKKIIFENGLNGYVVKKLEYISDSDIEYYFSCADLVVLPYKEHPFDTHGGVGALALSFKKPLVVTDVGGLSEYVKDDRVISNPNNPEELAQKIIFVLNNKYLLEKLSKDSEELSRELSWDKIADKTIEIYKKI